MKQRPSAAWQRLWNHTACGEKVRSFIFVIASFQLSVSPLAACQLAHVILQAAGHLLAACLSSGRLQAPHRCSPCIHHQQRCEAYVLQLCSILTPFFHAVINQRIRTALNEHPTLEHLWKDFLHKGHDDSNNKKAKVLPRSGAIIFAASQVFIGCILGCDELEHVVAAHSQSSPAALETKQKRRPPRSCLAWRTTSMQCA